MSEADVTQSVRYCGALCCWHWRTVTPSTAHVLGRPCRRAADVTDHDQICGYHWLGVQQHSALVEVFLSQTSAPRRRLVQSYSNRGASWQRRAPVSSRTQRRVNVGLVSVGEARKKTLRTHVEDVLVQTEVRWYRHVIVVISSKITSSESEAKFRILPKIPFYV